MMDENRNAARLKERKEGKREKGGEGKGRGREGGRKGEICPTF